MVVLGGGADGDKLCLRSARVVTWGTVSGRVMWGGSCRAFLLLLLARLGNVLGLGAVLLCLRGAVLLVLPGIPL